MYIRFYSGEIDARSQVAAGLFKASSDLWCANIITNYDAETISDLWRWFDEHLPDPFDYLPREKSFEQAVSWFKSTAHEHLARAWELAATLEQNDRRIWTIKAARVGYVHYEDEVQVFARPHPDIRLLLRGK